MLNVRYSKGKSSWSLTLLDHDELVQQLEHAAALAGWQLTYQKQTDQCVSRLTFSRAGRHENILAYVWSLKSRRNDSGKQELYVESNNGVPIRQVEGVKTLLIGYEASTDRFVGWAASRNSRAPIATAPSLVVSQEDFSHAYPDGLALCSRSENETAVIFRPDALMTYICNLGSFHGAVLEPEQNILRRMSQAEGQIEGSGLISSPADRQVAVKAIASQWCETSFRRRVLAAYQNRCAMCGGHSDVRVDVEAAYFVPAGHPESEAKTRNGLCLCELHHRAFDQGLIAVLPDYQIVVNKTKLEGLREAGIKGDNDTFIGYLRTHLSMPVETSQYPHASTIRTALRVRELQHDTLEAVPVITA